RLVVDAVAQPAGRGLAMSELAELGEEACRGALSDLLPTRTADRGIRRHEQHGLGVPVPRGESLEHGVGVAGGADVEGAHRASRARAVEDHYTARAAYGHEARQIVDERVPVGVAARVEEIG